VTAVSKNGIFSSGELAGLAGVSSDTLRHYERKGVLARPRSCNGYRQYPAFIPEQPRSESLISD